MKKHIRLLKNILITIIVIGVCGAGIMAVWISTFEIPSLDSFQERKVAQSTKIFDESGEVLLYDVFRNIQRTVVPFDEINDHMKNATLAIEDPAFFNHAGIKPTAILRATWVNIMSLDYTQGGSTITQQVVKNSILTSEKTIARKLKEWLLALKLEKIRTKDEIFTIYLNEIPYGGSLYGVEEAAQSYFGKKASELDLTESAYLAALPKAPTYYLNNPEQLNERKNIVLLEMRRNDYITAEMYKNARDRDIVISPAADQGIKAPHFVMYVREKLERRFGEDVVRQGGLRVTTTLDYELQKKAQDIVKENAKENVEKFNARNAATVVMDPTTGGIRTLVGSRDFFDKEINGQFNVATSPNRQPGSTFKPFAYAAAFNKGYTPSTILFDVATQFSTACEPSDVFNKQNPCYAPKNFDGAFRGPITMRDALAQSINIPAIKTLYLAGIQNTLTLARQMGVRNLGTTGQYGLTLVLGGGEVSLLDLTSAYSVFSNGGIKNEHFAIQEVKDKTGDTLYEHTSSKQRILDEEIALQITDILSDNEARAPVFGQNSYLHLPGYDVAVKTGTTNDYRDAWMIGYTKNAVVGSWAGNNDNTSMVKRVAGSIVGSMWNQIMRKVLEEYPTGTFDEPISTIDEDTKPVLRGEWRRPEGVHSILHWVNKENPRGSKPRVPASDVQYLHWEYSVQRWARAQNIDLPRDTDNKKEEENAEEKEE